MCIFLHLLFFFFFLTVSSSTPNLPDRFFKSSLSSSVLHKSTKEYFELTPPLPSDSLKPSCTVRVLRHDFGDTYGSPPVSVPYRPPSDCRAPWSYVVLELHVTCRGEQYDRIAAVWLGGVEIFRTSTAEPTKSGILWKVRKDVTRYSSLLALSNLTLTMMLENVVNDVFTGVYRVKLSLLYYDDGIRVPLTLAQPKMNRKLGILDDESVLESERSANNSQKNGALSFDAPADLVIPIADDGDKGFWFRIQSDSDIHSKKIRIPPNTRRAVLELCLSFHGDDEFWYSNPPDAYIILNNLSTRRGHGAFREVYVAIDGNFVASEIPFPVIFTGGINPLFWEPAVAIGAFNLPSYDVELTPFLGLLLDGKHHDFQLGVSEAVSFWLLGANLHLWLDPHLMKVEAKSVVYQAPTLSVERQSEFKMLDGSFEIEGERKTRVAGWVNSGDGNLTTHMSRRIKFKSSISFQKNGTSKLVKQKIKVKTDVRVLSHTGGLISRSSVKRKYPLNIITSTLPGKDKDTYLIMTNVSHALKEKLRTRGDQLSSVSNSQVSGGWMVVKDHSVSSGAADTQQALSHRKGRSCYSRTIAAANGKVLTDQSSDACEASW